MRDARPIRFPLYGKILLWFFLNLLLLALVFYLVVRAQFRFGLDSLFLSQAGQRIEHLSQMISEEMARSPEREWSAVLDRFGRAYRLEFYLFENDGTQRAGEPVQLPAEVRARLLERGGPGGGGGFGGPPGRGATRPGTPGTAHARFVLHTEQPHRYWVGVRIASPIQERGRPAMVTLLAVSRTLAGGGLFFEWRPWALAGSAAFVLSALFWLPLVHGLTRALHGMTRVTEEIAEGKFDGRVPVNRRDELGRLGAAINQMAARLAGFVTGQRRFLGDIAHELCSPLARMQVALGILDRETPPAAQSHLHDVQDELQHMNALVNELLSFSKAALQRGAIQLQPVRLQPIVDDVMTREALEAPAVTCDVAPDLTAWAEPELLRRSLANLVRNAVRYAGDAGAVRINAHRDGETIEVTVADSGPGVPEEVLAKIFDPFYRVDSARAPRTGGVGLGLAIVKTCIESCQGTVSAKNRSPHGLAVTLRLRAK